MKTKKIPKNEFSLNAIPRDEQKCIPACHTFYMSYDKHVKRMTSMFKCITIRIFALILLYVIAITYNSESVRQYDSK